MQTVAKKAKEPSTSDQGKNHKKPGPEEAVAQREINPLWHSMATNTGGQKAAGSSADPPPIQTKPLHSKFIQRVCADCEEEARSEPLSVQTKLTVGAPGDEYEREADAVADKVMRMPAESRGLDELQEDAPQIQTKSLKRSLIQRICTGCENELGSRDYPSVQTKSNGSGSQHSVPSSVVNAINSLGSGSPLNDSVRLRVEPILGADLSSIRTHSGTPAEDASKNLNARAFTNQNNIFLGRGESPSDLQLMAHEAAHTVQQSGVSPVSNDLVQKPKLKVSDPISFEAEKSASRSPQSDTRSERSTSSLGNEARLSVIQGSRPLAETTRKGSTYAPILKGHQQQSIIEAHEGVHRDQFALGQTRNVYSSRAQLEAEANKGAVALNRGESFSPNHAAAPDMRLFFDPDEPIPMADDIQDFGEREVNDLQTLNPGPGDQGESKIEMSRSESDTGVNRLLYDFHSTAEGARGSVNSHTVLRIRNDPNDPHRWLLPVNRELNLQDDPEFWKMYPIDIDFRRTIVYSDNHGRDLQVVLHAEVWFTYDQWARAVGSVSNPTLGAIADFQGDGGYMSVSIEGQGDLETFLMREYSALPAVIKNELLEDHTFFYYTSAHQTGNTLDGLSGQAANQFTMIGPSFPITLSNVPANFVYLNKTGGEQYDAIRDYLESYDVVHVLRWIARITQRLLSVSDNQSWLGDMATGLADAWNSLPAWLRGTLKTIGKTVAMIGAVIGIAALIVLTAPVELTVAGVALAIGVVMLAGSFLYSIYTRSMESVATNSGNPLSVFLVSLADAIGISGVYEGATNESILSGTPLGMDEEQQWETGTSGVVQLLMTFFGFKALRGRGKVPRTVEEPIVNTESIPLTEELVINNEPGMPVREPLFENITDSEINTIFGGAESPAATGGARPSINGRRVPTRQRRRLDVEDIPRRIGETASQAVARVRQIIGRKLSDIPALQEAWNQAAQKIISEKGALTDSNYVEHYNATRNQFWRNVRDSDTAAQAFEQAGFEMPSGRTTAARLENVASEISAQESRVSLDHVLEKAQGDNWQYALDADNLQMEIHNANSNREIIQMRHPDLRSED